MPLLLFCLASTARAQEAFDVLISVASSAPSRVRVKGVRSVGADVWSFRNAYAGVTGLGERVRNLSLADVNGADVPVQRLGPGEYKAARPATRFAYDVNLEPTSAAGDAAHVSWLVAEHGVLMLGDLLPLSATGVKMRFALPAEWIVASVEKKNATGQYELTDAGQAVFFVGQGLRSLTGRVGSMDFTFVTAGDWAFTDEDAAKAARDILKENERVMGGVPRERALVILAPFPRPASAQNWSAETRGGTVTLLSGRLASEAAGLAQLSVPLAHELFHLWVPNGLALNGDYDWFYEGFTLYQAVRVGMRLGHFTFQDYQNALGRAFDGYRSAKGRDTLSLLDASRRRWAGEAAVVYNKGMLVAFLYDLTVRWQTRGRRTLDDVYRELFGRHRSEVNRRDGNGAVISVLGESGETRDFVRRYIEGLSEIDLASALTPFGLQVETVGGRTRVTVADSPSRAQRDLLRELGYNEKAGAASRRSRGGRPLERRMR